MQTFFLFQNGAKGELAFASGEPLFFLSGVPGLPGELCYFAAQWVDAAARGEGFSMEGGYIDDPLVTVSPAETASAAAWIRARVAFLRQGSFKVSFVHNDPNLLF